MQSLWLDRPPSPFPAAEPDADAEFDVVVVGAGLTGLTTAVLLARAGMSVAVIEARQIGAGTTGHSTAKVSVLQGTRLSTIRHRHSAAIARQYVEANVEGQQWLRRYCENHDIALQTRSAYTYAATTDGLDDARRELAATQEAGLDTRWVSDTELPYQVLGAVELPDQYQIDPLDVLSGLAEDLVGRSGHLFAGQRVRAVRTGERVTVRTDSATVHAVTVVLATGVPIMDRGGFWARLQPMRSYAAAFQMAGPVPQGMYLSADSPTRSIRSAPRGAEELLLTGGNGHVVGRADHPAAHVRDLIDWTTRRFPGAEPTHTWSAQDYHADHDLPFIGPLTPGHDQVLVATGFDKWGLTLGVASGLALSSRILGGRTEWANALETWSTREVSGAGPAIKANVSVGAEMVGGWARSLLSPRDERPPAPGQGRVERHQVNPEAVCTVDGRTLRRSAVCTHLGGIVTWNDAELSWDCPLHGSRFAPDGSVLEGPATKDLPTRQEYGRERP